MHIPFFNHNEKLFHKVKDSGILFSEHAILKLLCITEPAIASEKEQAIKNFYDWQNKFIMNCEIAFSNNSDHLTAVYRPVFEHELLNCLFTAELFDWRDYNVLTEASSASFFEWNKGRIVTTRQLADLLALVNYHK